MAFSNFSSTSSGVSNVCNPGKNSSVSPYETSDMLTRSRIEERIELLTQDVKKLEIDTSNDTAGDCLSLETANSNLKQPLQRNSTLDTIFKKLMQRGRERNEGIMRWRKKLPSYGKKDELLRMIKEKPVVLITGETGCGKTTQIPQYILDDYIESGDGSLCKIICTQPRKISAIAVSKRVAKERGEYCGKNQSTGYHIRLDSNLPRDTGSILFCTSGILIKYLHMDPNLSSYSHVILDEVHERNLETDFLIIILRDLLKQRSNLRLILMSATIKSESFSDYFDKCPIMEIPGASFPVVKYMLEDVLEMTAFSPTDSTFRIGNSMMNHLENISGRYSQRTRNAILKWNEDRINFYLVLALLQHICKNEGDGAVLVFLPGWEEINDLYGVMSRDFSESKFLIIILHSMVPIEEQEEVFNPPPPGVRKIVLATNIAETSITIDDVSFVIDCGKMKMAMFDGKRNISTLEPCWISKANAQQRRGRAGRTRPGKCYHLFTSYRESKMLDHHPPEIVRTRLENICLIIKHLKLGDIRKLLLKAMDRPSESIVALSIKLLQQLEALDEYENLTLMGSTLAQLPLDPLLGRMLLFGIVFSCLSPILTIVSVLEYKDPFYVPKKKQTEGDFARLTIADNCESDHIMFAKAFEMWSKSDSKSRFCKENFLSMSSMKMIKKVRLQLAGELYNLGLLVRNDPEDLSANKNSQTDLLVRGCICTGLYPNIASVIERRKSNIVCLTKEDGKVSVHRKSIQSISPHFFYDVLLYYNKQKTSKIFLYDTTVVSPSMVYIFCGKSADDPALSVVKQSGLGFSDWKEAEKVGKLLFELVEKVIGRKVRIDWNKVDPWISCLHATIDIIRSITNYRE